MVVSSGTGNRILSNSIFSNGSTADALGIDLGDNGVTANDPKDPDTGANQLQNFPVITSTFILRDPLIGTTTNISGKLNSTPSTRVTKRTFIIQFFSSSQNQKDSSGFGEGKTFLGQKIVTTNRNGNASFDFSTSVASEGDLITLSIASASREVAGSEYP